MNPSAETLVADSSQQGSTGPVATFYQRLLVKVLKSMKAGRLDIHLPNEQKIVLGGDANGPHAAIMVRHMAFFQKCVLFGGVGFGEAYVDGDWETPDLRAVIEWFVHNVRNDPKLRGSSQRIPGVGLLRWFNRVQHLLRPNSNQQLFVSSQDDRQLKVPLLQ